MAKQEIESKSNQLNLTVVALVALVAIVGLVALVMNAASIGKLAQSVSTGSQMASAQPESTWSKDSSALSCSDFCTQLQATCAKGQNNDCSSLKSSCDSQCGAGAPAESTNLAGHPVTTIKGGCRLLGCGIFPWSDCRCIAY